jgi:hypothetical protein
MVITRAEFAHLHYPHTPMASGPAEMGPELSWFLMLQNSEKGLTRVVRRLGNRPLGYVAHSCDSEPLVQGPNRVWSHCVLRRVDAEGDTITQRLFGGILERDGAFKLISFANEF